VDIAAIRTAKFKAVVDYSYGSTSFVMPNVLAKLGADILGLNPYASTVGALAYDRDEHSQQVAAYVRTSGAQVGAVLDPDGEHLTLIDDTGHILSDEEALLSLLTLVSGKLIGDTVALPVNVTSHAESIAGVHDVRVRRTKLSAPALMDAASEPGVGFAGSSDGGFILPGFLPAFDAAASLVKLLELLAASGSRLSTVVEALPRTHMAHETVVTPWEQKGTVMRSLVEMSKDREVQLIDGIKVHHGDAWALALPDPEEPVTHIWSEGPTDAEARSLAGEYARRIRQLLR
jgi:mannose-1-phosphate guanylyltransferase/phosphomannomutase